MTYLLKNDPESLESIVNKFYEGMEQTERVHKVLEYLLERGCSERLFVRVLNMCPDAECDECGKLVCINGEPLHFHHDGCPGCDGTTNRWKVMEEARLEAAADAKWEADTMQGIHDELSTYAEFGGAHER